MGLSALHFMRKKARILRANYMVDITTIRDRILTDYSMVQDKVSIRIDPNGGDIQYNNLGPIAVERFLAYVPPHTPVLPLDLLLVDGVYYEVHIIEDFSAVESLWHLRLNCIKKNYQRS